MKRSRVVATILVATTCAVVGLAGAGSWTRLAYRRDTETAFQWLKGGRVHERQVRWKRATWIPGRDVILADERCSPCVVGQHQGCTVQISLVWNADLQVAGHTRADSSEIPQASCRCSCKGRQRKAE